MRVGRVVPTTLVVTGLLLALVSSPAQARSTRGRILAKVNSIRASHSIRRLDCLPAVNNIAQAHSRRMANSNTMFHTPDLYSKLSSRVRLSTWGENVGYAPHWWRVVRLWMRSASHRHNILNGRFGRCGVGVASRGGRVWITMIYLG